MKKLLFLLPLLALSLGGCKEQPKEAPSSSEVSSSEVSSSESSSEEPVVYTLASVAADIGESLGIALTDQGTYYSKALNFSEEGVDYSNTKAEESVLKPVVQTLENYMPEYLTLVGEKYFTSEEDFWEDESGDTVYYALLSVDSINVGLIGYCYSDCLIGQIEVSSAE